jgi:leader peptidase (prepilin peptidase) / N-methyltransferase
MLPPAAHWLIVLTAAAFGGAVGSFLNVVVYRLPLGLSLVTPPSHCPQCKTPIRWFDNVPVFGWIMLGGRCRQCRCRIPVRYPVVEALTAAMFVAVALVECPLQATCPYHLVLLSTLLAAALIEVDGHRPPPHLFAPALAAGIVVPLLWPVDQSAMAWDGRFSISPAQMDDVIVGLLAGAAMAGAGWLLWRVDGWRRGRAAADSAPLSIGLLGGLVCTGESLGLPAVCAIFVLVAATRASLLLPKRGSPRIHVPPSVWLLVFAFVWILGAARLVPQPLGW